APVAERRWCTSSARQASKTWSTVTPSRNAFTPPMVRGHEDVPGFTLIATVAARYTNCSAQIAAVVTRLTTHIEANKIARFHDYVEMVIASQGSKRAWKNAIRSRYSPRPEPDSVRAGFPACIHDSGLYGSL